MFGLLPPSSRVTGIRFWRRVLHDQPAGGGLAGERDLGDAVARRQRLARLHAEAVDDVEHTRGQQVADQRQQVQDRRRGLLGGFEDDRVARGQRRSELPDGHQDREVPRDDLADDAERLVEVIGDGVVVDLATASPPARGSRPAKYRKWSTANGMSALSVSRIGLPLSHDFGDGDRLEILLDAVGDLVQDHGALGRGRLAPRRCRRVCGIQCPIDISLVGAGHLAEHLAGDRCGVFEVSALCGSDPLAADVVVVAGVKDISEPSAPGRA